MGDRGGGGVHQATDGLQVNDHVSFAPGREVTQLPVMIDHLHADYPQYSPLRPGG